MTTETRNTVTYVFLFIVLLTAIAALASNLGLFGLDPDSNFSKTSLVSILVEVAAAVIYVWQTGALQPNTVSAFIPLSQNTESSIGNLDPDNCTYIVRSIKSEIKDEGKVAAVLRNAAWEFRLPSPKMLDDSITLRLVEKDGTVWEVRPFYPLSTQVTAVREILPLNK
jgi:hypothetical protein